MKNMKWLAELLGTYILVFGGTATILATKGSLTDFSIAFGLALVIAIYALGPTSGGHFNPAVTIAFWVRKAISLTDAVWYILSQLVGAVLASATVCYVFGNKMDLGATVPGAGTTWQQVFVLELVLTFILMLVILGAAVSEKANRAFAGLAIGGTVALANFLAATISGASLNPARSFGPAVVSGNFTSFWIYIVAPIVGALIAVLIYKLFEKSE